MAPHLYNSFCDDKIHDIATKGVVIWNKVQMITSHAHAMENFGVSKTDDGSSDIFPYILWLMGLQPLQTSSLVWILESSRTCILAKSPRILMERKDFPHHNKTQYGLQFLVRHFKALAENDFCLVRDDCCIRNLGIQRNFDYFRMIPDPLAWYALPSNTINSPSIESSVPTPRSPCSKSSPIVNEPHYRPAIRAPKVLYWKSFTGSMFFSPHSIFYQYTTNYSESSRYGFD